MPDPPEYVYEPQVLMTQQHADSCLVKVGDPFPAAELPDLAGEKHSLESLFGQKLTVVVFWSNENLLGREQIRRLEAEVVSPFKDAGLSVVAINIGDPADQIRELFADDGEVDFTILLDEEKSLYSKVATEHHPRTYLLDANGKILWLDIEYARGMARDLNNAIHVYLGLAKTG
ncbi:MAG: redoxin domain-containing protein, partial [Pirellulaceae bacterium]